MDSNNNFSKKAIVSLMVLTIIITFIGTLLIFSSIDNLRATRAYNEDNTQSGKVGINILSEGSAKEVISSGKVGITILDNNKKIDDNKKGEDLE